MKEVIGVRFRTNGKIYFFDPLDFHVQLGDDVIVETARGVEYGKCVLGRREISEPKRIAGLKPIIRLANEDDKKKYEENKEKCIKAQNIKRLKNKYGMNNFRKRFLIHSTNVPFIENV